ncbi:MAG: 2'-5' RNA ligase family protein [Nocardioidaceae bacterium]
MSTIGVAIAVPEPWGGYLEQRRHEFGDPLAGSIPAHVTLVPPTKVDAAQAALDRHLSAVAGAQQPFGIRLRGTATFRPVTPVVFISVTEGISSCEVLASALRSGPLDQALSFPYHPHVTVAHHLSEDALDNAYQRLADFDCAFDVTAIHAYQHGSDGVWRPVATFGLGG